MKTKAKSEFITEHTQVGVPAYFPFAKGEMVQSVLLSEPTACKISVVEGQKEVANSKDTTVIDLGFLKTNCLIVETEKSVKVEVLIIKKK